MLPPSVKIVATKGVGCMAVLGRMAEANFVVNLAYSILVNAYQNLDQADTYYLQAEQTVERTEPDCSEGQNLTAR